MAGILRGEVYGADLGPRVGHEQGGLRPVMVVSHDVLNRRSGTVIVLAITSQEQRAGYPLTHRLRSAGLPKSSWVKMSQVRTLSVARLRERIGAIADEELSHIVEGLVAVLA